MKHKAQYLTPKKFVIKLEQLLGQSSAPLSAANPTFDDGEIARAKFIANEIAAQLGKPADESDEAKMAASRHRTLVGVFLFQMIIGGIIQWVKALMAQEKAKLAAAKIAPIIDAEHEANMTNDISTTIKEINYEAALDMASKKGAYTNS